MSARIAVYIRGMFTDLVHRTAGSCPALAELGSDLCVEDLDVFGRPDLCIARLNRR